MIIMALAISQMVRIVRSASALPLGVKGAQVEGLIPRRRQNS